MVQHAVYTEAPSVIFYNHMQLISGYTFNSCNMGRRVLPDMYTRIPRATGPRDEGGHIRQNPLAMLQLLNIHLKCMKQPWFCM